MVCWWRTVRPLCRGFCLRAFITTQLCFSGDTRLMMIMIMMDLYRLTLVKVTILHNNSTMLPMSSKFWLLFWRLMILMIMIVQKVVWWGWLSMFQCSDRSVISGLKYLLWTQKDGRRLSSSQRYKLSLYICATFIIIIAIVIITVLFVFCYCCCLSKIVGVVLVSLLFTVSIVVFLSYDYFSAPPGCY